MIDHRPTKSPTRPANAASTGQRAALAVAGVCSWVAGAVATFTTSGAGAAALIGAGGLCGVLALLGRWPSRITLSGNEFSWEDVKKTVDSQIEAAETSGETEDAIQELKSLRERIDALQATGTVPDHPAAEYDRAVEAAIRRLIPNADIQRTETRSREVPGLRIGRPDGAAIH